MRRIIGLLCMVVVTAPARADDKDLVSTASSAGQFTTLCKALQSAGLVDTLRGPGPFTVFAPTDEAFGKLPPGTLEDLMRPENRRRLAALLTYHVVASKLMASDVTKMSGTNVRTMEGMMAPIRVEAETVMVGPARVVQPDIEASNGVLHAIDFVLLPPNMPATGAFSATRVQATGLAPVVIPSDRALTPTAYYVQTQGTTLGSPAYPTMPATTTPARPAMTMQPFGSGMNRPRMMIQGTRLRTQRGMGGLFNRLGIGRRGGGYSQY